ncbi:MAG: NAD(P)H-dependent oxidoreductase [Bacteroidota bacterium]|nr:NAD(P)H-dependent oxidoreductase [Bacteroidota bacterium]MDP4229729.1 NAD(P)H-dependent oxidoreductase [Bacteroidota bacterium]MDP4237665.1 NAD(P)H-dependent oxidoreductase [Bacteroidota bacterium]
MHFLGISGSLRKGSYNTMLLKVALGLVPEGVTTEIGEISDLPLYNADVEVAAYPEPALRLKEQIRKADALVFATPEYNYSMPGVLKNAIDWVSRPPKDSPFFNKPFAILSASTGILGGARAQYHLRQSAVFLNMHPLNRPEVIVAKAQDKFDSEGNFNDEAGRDLIKKQMAALLDWTKLLQGKS